MGTIIKNTTSPFSDGDQITSEALNNLIDDAVLNTTAVSSGTGLTVDASTGVLSMNTTLTGKTLTSGSLNSSPIGASSPSTGAFTTLSASGVVSVADGSESVPSITNTGDTNTGIYFPAENSVALTAGAGATLTSTNTAITIDVPTSIVSTAQSDLTLQGGDANSKNLIFKKASAQQGKISAVGDELKFYAGTSANDSLEITATTSNVKGTLLVGSDDTTPNGMIKVYGGGTSQNEGGEIQLLTAADYDGTYDYYRLDAFQDDLRIGRSGEAADITLNSSGNVGIGTAAPAHKLSISEASTDFAALITNSTSSGNGLKINAGDNVGDRILELNDKDGNAKFVVKSTAAVGIGTASPAEELHINAPVPKIQIQDSDGTDQYGQFYHSAGVTGIQARNNTSDGTIVFQKYDGTTTDETMRISSAGNVGIGDNDPSKELVVKNIATAGTESVINVISGNAGVAGLYLGDSDDDIVGGIVYDNSADTLQLRSSNNQTAVTIDSSERVGIGASPSYKLDVSGDIRATGAIRDSSGDAGTAGQILSSTETGTNWISNTGGSSQWTTSGSDIYYNTGNVGIADASPSYKLDVNGTFRTTDDIYNNISGTQSGLPGYYKGTYGAQIESTATGSTLHIARSGGNCMNVGADATAAGTDVNVVYFRDTGAGSSVANEVGKIIIDTSSTNYETSSDYRLKENEVDITNGIDRLKELKPYRFNFTRNPSKVVDGFFAHEVSTVVPESISGEKDQVDDEGSPVYQGIDQSKLVPLLTAALQEAVSKIEALEARVQTLEG